jgi:hypothetical protein
MQGTSNHKSSQTEQQQQQQQQPELSRLTGIIRNLRKVGNPDQLQKTKKPPPDKSDQQALEILKMLAQLRHRDPNPKNTGTHNSMQDQELMEILANLRNVGALRYKMNRKETEALEDCIKRLRTIRIHLNGDDVKELDDMIGKLEMIGMDQEHIRGAQVIEDAISRLKKVTPKLLGGPEDEIDDIATKLDKLRARMSQREEDELAEAIRNLRHVEGSGSDADDLARVLKDLQLVVVGAAPPEEEPKAPSTPKSSKPSREESEYLKTAIQRLKRVRMTKREAEAVADIVSNRRTVVFPVSDTGAQDKSSSKDEPPEIDELRNTFDSAVKAEEVVDVIKGLRKLHMTDEETEDLADIIRTFGSGSRNFREDLADAITRLKKVKMNKKETAAVAYVIRNLRKVTKYSPEMVAIEKVVRPERYEEVVETISALKKLDLSSQEAGELAAIVQGMGSEEVDPILLDLEEWESGSISDMSSVAETGEMALKGPDDDDAPPVHVSHHKGLPEVDLDDSMNIIVDEAEALKDPDDNNAPPVHVSHHKELPVVDLDESMNTLVDEAEALKDPDDDDAPPVRVSHHKGAPLVDLDGSMNSILEDKAEEPEPHKTIHAERHQWKHKKHWRTFQGDRRYRPQDQRNTTVVYSSLSNQQKDRRRLIEASMNMNASLPSISADSHNTTTSDDEDHNASWLGSTDKASRRKK